MAPFKFGDRIVKMSVKPQNPEQSPEILPEFDNYLREVMVKYLGLAEKARKQQEKD